MRIFFYLFVTVTLNKQQLSFQNLLKITIIQKKKNLSNFVILAFFTHICLRLNTRYHHICVNKEDRLSVKRQKAGIKHFFTAVGVSFTELEN